MELKKIMRPTDFSGSAEKALAYMKVLTEKYNTEVHVLYVIEDLAHHVEWYGEFEQPHIDKIMKWEEEKAKERLDQICQNHLEECPLYVKHIAVEDPAQEILKLIEQEQVDMVVMSSSGRQGKFRFGSVAEKVVKNSEKPVVTIPINP